MRRIIFSAAFIILTICILTNSGLSLAYARNGLELWFNNMIPTLLPFMILSGTLVRMGLTDGFVMLVYPFVKPVFRVSRSVCYVMIMGFMCGFPMGAKCVDDMYSCGKISDKEAAWLLAFCNNIGPVYFISFALPLIGCRNWGLCVFGMYGIPVLYGLFLRYTIFRNIQPKDSIGIKETQAGTQTFFAAINESVYASMQSILMLGGYMVLFNLLMMLPVLWMEKGLLYIAPFWKLPAVLSF